MIVYYQNTQATNHHPTQVKTPMKTMQLLLLGAALTALSGPALAAWTLDAADSRLNFSFIKKLHVVESGHFTEISGSVNDTGAAQLQINLGTVNTLIAIRDQRLREFLFETSSHPSAVYSTHIDPDALNDVLAADSGSQQLLTLQGHLELHGIKKPLNAEVIITKTGPNSLSVDSARPLVIKAADYGLVPGIDKLQALAKLPHIAHSVPLSFHLVYRAQ